MVDEWPKYIYLKKNNSKHFLPRLSYGNIPYRNNLQANNVTYVWFIYRVYQNIFHIFVLYIYIYIYIYFPGKCPLILLKIMLVTLLTVRWFIVRQAVRGILKVTLSTHIRSQMVSKQGLCRNSLVFILHHL